jgi:hypothetical protein
MDAAKVRQIVREELQRSSGMQGASINSTVQREIQRSNNAKRFGVNNIPFHTHDGINSPRIKEENIVPSVNTAGSITFGTQGATYTIKFTSNFTPSNILAYGTVRDTVAAASATRRCHTVGSAQLTRGFYLQPETNRSVVMGGPEYPFPTSQPDGSKKTVPIQGSSFISVTNAGVVSSGTSEDHLVSIFDGDAISDIRARVTVVDFSNSFIKLYVPYLDTNWRIEVNYVIS